MTRKKVKKTISLTPRQVKDNSLSNPKYLTDLKKKYIVQYKLDLDVYRTDKD